MLVWVLTCGQGVSSAGNQLGRRDARSRLVEEPFKTHDRLPHSSVPEKQWPGWSVRLIMRPVRRAILLENVGALLSCQEMTRALLAFIFKDAWSDLEWVKQGQATACRRPGRETWKWCGQRSASARLGCRSQPYLGCKFDARDSVDLSVHVLKLLLIAKPTKANRKRVFLLLMDPLFQFPDWVLCCCDRLLERFLFQTSFPCLTWSHRTFLGILWLLAVSLFQSMMCFAGRMESASWQTWTLMVHGTGIAKFQSTDGCSIRNLRKMLSEWWPWATSLSRSKPGRPSAICQRCWSKFEADQA